MTRTGSSRHRLVLPIETKSDQGKCLAGLLTCASSVLDRLPRAFSSSGLLGRTSALTVAGQWRNYTALPNYQTIRLYLAGQASVNDSTSRKGVTYVSCRRGCGRLTPVKLGRRLKSAEARLPVYPRTLKVRTTRTFPASLRAALSGLSGSAPRTGGVVTFFHAHSHLPG